MTFEGSLNSKNSNFSFTIKFEFLTRSQISFQEATKTFNIMVNRVSHLGIGVFHFHSCRF